MASTPDWRLAGSELDLTVDGYGTLKHGRFLARDIPVLYVPYLIFPAKTTRQSGLLFPRVSYSRDKNGLDVEIPFFWAVSESADATFSQRYLEKRGFKEGLEVRYFPARGHSAPFTAIIINDRQAYHGNRRRHQPRLAGGSAPLVLLSQPRNDHRRRYFPPERHPPGIGSLVFPGFFLVQLLPG